MKKLWIFLIMTLVLLLPALAAAADYEIILPAGYETGSLHYPTAYIFPQDGYSADNSGIAEKFSSEQMILVQPVFTENADVLAETVAIVADVDSKYRTIPDNAHRAAVGTGTGGYLAYVSALADDSQFGFAASIRGNFADNPWLSSCGSVMERIQTLYAKNNAYFDTIYTYMDAPVDDVWTNMPGSTNEMGSLFIGYGTGSAFHEYTVRPGKYDDAFLSESANRVLSRLTANMSAGLAYGTITPEKTTLTAADETLTLNYAVTITDAVSAYVSGETQMLVRFAVSDASGEIGGGTTAVTVTGPGEYTGTLQIENILKNNSSSAALSIELMGTEINLASCTLILATDPVIDGDFQQIELMGDWYFNYVGAQELLDVAALTKEEYSAWSVVQPGITSWTKGFGNISEENVFSAYGPDYFNYFIVGSGYYAKTFTVPQDFDAKELVLAAGYIDDRCEVFLNGVKVGATGMDENGQPTGETTWAVFSHFDIDPSLLNVGGENVMVVRAWNDLPFGAGGWYGGPIGLYSKAAFEAQYAEGANPRFYEETFESAHVAAATGVSSPAENKYLIYLPEGYDVSDRRYPTVYLLHQFNSDHTSYRTDKIDQLMDAGIKAGAFDEMIVVIPNSSEESWWTGEWEQMITDELIPLIDNKYRTIRDARYRLTAGCSMGGQGAMAVALRNPDFFSGAVSFFGAFSYGGASSPNTIAQQESAEYMDYFTTAFICGNQDSYGFGVPAIALNQQLEKMGVEHYFLIDNGGHDSTFYVPYFDECFSYVRANMYKSDAAAEALLSGTLTIDDETVTATLIVDPAIAPYMNTIPASSYTKTPAPALNIPLLIETVEDGKVVSVVEWNDISVTPEVSDTTFFFTHNFQEITGKTFVFKAQLFDRVVTLAEISAE